MRRRSAPAPGKDRTTVLQFHSACCSCPIDLQQLVAERRLSARPRPMPVSLPTPELQREVAEKAAAQGWSVRQTERTTQKMIAGRQAKHVDEVQSDPNVKAAVEQMQQALGTKVRIVGEAQKGRPHRNRILFAGRPGPHLWQDRGGVAPPLR